MIKPNKSNFILTENEDIDTRQITRFIRSVCDHLYARFPPDELECWSAFDPTALKNCTFNFGVAEVKKLYMPYKDLINVTNGNLIIKQYNDLKTRIKRICNKQWKIASHYATENVHNRRKRAEKDKTNSNKQWKRASHFATKHVHHRRKSAEKDKTNSNKQWKPASHYALKTIAPSIQQVNLGNI